MGGELLSVLKRLGPQGEALLAKLSSTAGMAGNTAKALGEKAGLDTMLSKARYGAEGLGMKHGLMAEDALSGGRYMTKRGKNAALGAGLLGAGGAGAGLAALLGDDDEDEDDDLGI